MLELPPELVQRILAQLPLGSMALQRGATASKAMASVFYSTRLESFLERFQGLDSLVKDSAVLPAAHPQEPLEIVAAFSKWHRVAARWMRIARFLSEEQLLVTLTLWQRVAKGESHWLPSLVAQPALRATPAGAMLHLKDYVPDLRRVDFEIIWQRFSLWKLAVPPNREPWSDALLTKWEAAHRRGRLVAGRRPVAELLFSRLDVRVVELYYSADLEGPVQHQLDYCTMLAKVPATQLALSSNELARKYLALEPPVAACATPQEVGVVALIDSVPDGRPPRDRQPLAYAKLRPGKCVVLLSPPAGCGSKGLLLAIDRQRRECLVMGVRIDATAAFVSIASYADLQPTRYAVHLSLLEQDWQQMLTPFGISHSGRLQDSSAGGIVAAARSLETLLRANSLLEKLRAEPDRLNASWLVDKWLESAQRLRDTIVASTGTCLQIP
mmetsp:Transcript_1811/g.2945  ORF Transcript_1811/g.2945 Transcript_1811/m.2945 type:complete len:441 (-) Transcript_1811:12-1334(-)